MTGEDILIKSTLKTILDLIKFSKRNILVFMQSKHLAVKMEDSLIPEFITAENKRIERDYCRNFNDSEWVLANFQVIHQTAGELNWYIEENFRKDSTHKVVVITWARSILSEGIDIPNNTVSAILVCGLPWANKTSKEISAMKYFMSLHLDTNETDAVDKVLYLSEMRNTVNQTIGRLARSPTSHGIVMILDSGYTHLMYPLWALENETSLVRNRETHDKHRIDRLQSRGVFNVFLESFKRTQK
jgi:Rad3-related DNA helicase